MIAVFSYKIQYSTQVVLIAIRTENENKENETIEANEEARVISRRERTNENNFILKIFFSSAFTPPSSFPLYAPTC